MTAEIKTWNPLKPKICGDQEQGDLRRLIAQRELDSEFFLSDIEVGNNFAAVENSLRRGSLISNPQRLRPHHATLQSSGVTSGQ